jgi:DNA invertase Pin-like site-specific DNA recombinase
VFSDRGATEQPIDTGTPVGKAFLDMLGVLAEFEATIRKERQMEGIAEAMAAGVYNGGKPSVDAARVRDYTRRAVSRRSLRGSSSASREPAFIGVEGLASAVIDSANGARSGELSPVFP